MEPGEETVARGEGDVNLSPRREAYVARHLDAAAGEILAADARWFFRQSLSTPCLDVLASAHGSRLVTTSGHRLLDFHGNGLHQLGHGHPKVIAAIEQALAELPFSPRRFTNRFAVALAERLCGAMAEGPWKLLLAPAGALAVSTAVKLARLVTGRHKILSFWGSFHGASLDAISVGGEPLFRRGIGPLLPATEHIPPPTRGRCRFGCPDEEHSNCLAYLAYVLETEGDFAALIAEPVRWTTVELPPPGYWRRVREICDRLGVLLIFDEIPSCLGRTGRLFVHQQLDAVPDILVLGKGLGGGVFPLAAMLARAAFDRFPETALGHYTHEKSAPGCAAALAALEVIEEEDLCTRASRLGAILLTRLAALRSRFPLVREIRGIGLHLGVELRQADGSPAVEAAEAVLYACLDRGLSFKIGGGNVLVLSPPLTIPEKELEEALAILEAAFEEVSDTP